MNYEREFTALADLAIKAGLLTPSLVAMLKRPGTRKSAYKRRQLIDLIGFLREKVSWLADEDIDDSILIQSVTATMDAIEEAWLYEE